MPGITTKRQFVDRGIKSEIDAICHEVKVVKELLCAGYVVDKHCLKWFRIFEKGGRNAVKKAFEKAYTSNTGEKYRDYYAHWYDDVLDEA